MTVTCESKDHIEISDTNVAQGELLSCDESYREFKRISFLNFSEPEE